MDDVATLKRVVNLGLTGKVAFKQDRKEIEE